MLFFLFVCQIDKDLLIIPIAQLPLSTDGASTKQDLPSAKLAIPDSPSETTEKADTCSNALLVAPTAKAPMEVPIADKVAFAPEPQKDRRFVYTSPTDI